MYKIKDLSNQSLNTDLIGKFVDFVVKKLQIDEPFTVYFVDDKENGEKELGKTAMYNPETKSVYVYATNRHPKDMMRSCAHELMHHKQNIAGELGEITPDEAERQANEAGYILRQFEDGMKKETLEEGIKIRLNEVDASRLGLGSGQGVKGQVDASDPSLRLRKYKENEQGSMGPGDYKKCLNGQEKRRGLCYPKKFKGSFNTRISDLSLRDLYFIYNDIRRSHQKQRESVFGHNPRLKRYASIYGKIRKTMWTVKTAPKLPDDYIPRRTKYYKKLKDALDALNEGKITRKELYEQANENTLIIYPQNVIDDARRVYKLFQDGYYYYGPKDDPFGSKIKIPAPWRDEIERKLGGKKRVREIEEIYSVNASSAAAINKADESFAESVHLTLDIVGMSPDPYGVGILADVINAILYFSRGMVFDGVLSLSAVAFFGDALKISRGPLRKFIQWFIDVRKGALYWLDYRLWDPIIEALSGLLDFLKSIKTKLIDKIGAMGTGIPLFGKKADDAVKGFDECVRTVEAMQDIAKAQKTITKRLDVLFRGKLPPKLVTRVLTENPKVLIDFLEPFLKRHIADLLSKGANARKALKMLAAELNLPRNIVDILNKEKLTQEEISVLIQYADGHRRELIEKLYPKLLEAVKEQKGLMDELVGVIAETLDTVELDKIVIDELKKAAADTMKEFFGDLSKKSYGEIVEILKKFPLEDAMNRIDDVVAEKLAAVLPVMLDKSPELKKMIAEFVGRAYARSLPNVLPGAVRSTRRYASYVYGFMKASLGMFIYKNILGAEGALGYLYGKTIKVYLRVLGSSFTLWSVVPKVVIAYGVSLPVIILGKLNLFGIYYNRYYRHFCGGPEEFRGKIMMPAVEKAWKLWSSPRETGVKLWQWASEPASDHFWEDASDKIIKSISSQFACKNRNKILMGINNVRLRNQVGKEIAKMEAALGAETVAALKKESKKIAAYGKSYVGWAKDDTITTKSYADMCMKVVDEMSQTTPQVETSPSSTVAQGAARLRELAKKARETAKGLRGKVEAGAKAAEKAALEAAAGELDTDADQVDAVADDFSDLMGRDPDAPDQNEHKENLSLNDVLREHKEKELNDKFNKLIKGVTE